MGAKIQEEKLNILPVFKYLMKLGNISKRDMFNTFNMGVGMTVIVDRNDVQNSLEILKQNGEAAYVIGEVVEQEGINIC